MRTFLVEKMDMNPQKGIDEDFRYIKEGSLSTGFLYHGFGIVGYNYVKTRYQGNAVIIKTVIPEKRSAIRNPGIKELVP